MKRLSLLGFFGIISALLAGCPIYDDEGTPFDPQCQGNRCDPPPGTCSTSTDCNFNETCGQDNQCHPGDCSVWGCPAGQACVINSDFTATCEPGTGSSSSSSSSGGSSSSSSSSSSSGGNLIYCGNPSDCAPGQTCAPDGTCQAGTCDVIGCIYGYACTADGCVPENPSACGEDADCAGLGAGYACVSGICTAPADQCSDQTQCPSGNKCVAGKCTQSCTTNANCSGGYACDTTLGICTLPVKPCSITNDCGGPDNVCVAGTCVPRSILGTCPLGYVWVENGCIPGQSASFVCNQDGVQDACATGSICLHHNCYISCAPPDSTVCDNLSFNLCKTVTTVSGDHQVCGSDSNLGSDCDPTAGLACSPGKVCIDGYCK